MKNKIFIRLSFLILITAVVFFTVVNFTSAQEETDKQFFLDTKKLLDDLKGGEVLMNPGAGTVCFNAKRLDLNEGEGGQFQNQTPDAVERVRLRGKCPFDSGCALFRVYGGTGVDYVKNKGAIKPDENDFVDLKITLPKSDHIDEIIEDKGLLGHVLYFYYGRGTFNTPPPSEETGQGVGTAEAKSQNLGIITFNFSASGEPPEGTEQTCEFIAWDPYGRVFDAVSLEPIPNINVALIDSKTGEPAVQRFQANNDTTLADGLFNILVENEGIYQLSLNGLSSHKFSDNPTLNPNYSRIYYDLYYPDDVFEEKKGVPTHHDIPLQPIGTPYYAPKVEIMKLEPSINMGLSTLYKGRVSHPFAKVCLKGEESGKEYGCVANADRFGIFQIYVKSNKVPIEERLIPVATKVNIDQLFSDKKTQQTLNIDSLSDGGKENQNEILGYDPVFSHLEGFAYDGKGNISPQATINIVLRSNNKIAYSTVADDKGFFIIKSENLPIMEYEIRVIPLGSTMAVRYSTTEFARLNKSYLNSNKVNLQAITKDGQAIDKRVKNSGEDNPDLNLSKESVTGGKSTLKNSFNFKILLVIFILIVLVVVSIGIVVHIKKSRADSER
ncbi:hypothetical protein H3C65_03595 [Patescibacteria group bacterium]|nr:hypothetical protein [Patescibacteria group bacterium]